MNRKYYLAYGMNTNLDSMKVRCPDAITLGVVLLEDHALNFKYFCDAEHKLGKSMECALWSITDKCEQSLDRLEGYPDFYLKKEVNVTYLNKTIQAMIYFMPEHNELDFPSEHYFNMVCEGYEQHNMNLDSIYAALKNVVKETNYVHSMG
jgi:gamma-glutamylcyclotransferase (GGCT)/AIG2-like uncharacterized protein YtfP